MGSRSGQASHGAHDADRTRDLVLTKDVLYQLSYVGHVTEIRHSRGIPFVVSSIVSRRLPISVALRLTSSWSGRWELNPRQPAWKAGTLPLSYARLVSSRYERGRRKDALFKRSHCRQQLPALVGRQGFEPWKPMATDLQSAPFGHLGTCPNLRRNSSDRKIVLVSHHLLMGKEE